MTINTDTNKIKLSGENLEKLANEYNQVIEKVFGELITLETNGKWVGENYNSGVCKYIENVKKEKEQYYNLALNLKNLGISLKDYATNLEKTTDIKL